MMEYPKINSLWKRQGWYFEAGKNDKSSRQSLIIGDYAQPEFGNIKRWLVDEKIDGTNVRVMWERPYIGGSHTLTFGGRTDNAQMPTHLLTYLQKAFNEEHFVENFPQASSVILFGEGYGTKIQAAGSNYCSDVGFMLFDIFIDGWWLKRETVRDVALKMGLQVVPEIGVMTEEEVVAFVISKPISRCSHIPQMMEGVVCRSEPLMLCRNKKPILWKLKCKEFV